MRMEKTTPAERRQIPLIRATKAKGLGKAFEIQVIVLRGCGEIGLGMWLLNIGIGGGGGWGG